MAKKQKSSSPASEDDLQPSLWQAFQRLILLLILLLGPAEGAAAAKSLSANQAEELRWLKYSDDRIEVGKHRSRKQIAKPGTARYIKREILKTKEKKNSTNGRPEGRFKPSSFNNNNNNHRRKRAKSRSEEPAGAGGIMTQTSTESGTDREAEEREQRAREETGSSAVDTYTTQLELPLLQLNCDGIVDGKRFSASSSSSSSDPLREPRRQRRAAFVIGQEAYRLEQKLQSSIAGMEALTLQAHHNHHHQQLQRKQPQSQLQLQQKLQPLQQQLQQKLQPLLQQLQQNCSRCSNIQQKLQPLLQQLQQKLQPLLQQQHQILQPLLQQSSSDCM
ncbi:MAG: hypothetical protein J3Q66DRAFT_400011 [Benniella sp.]|nr:MAG: hypothetical protein J3Q66DRAFT_400011 [Benniella sp.]